MPEKDDIEVKQKLAKAAQLLLFKHHKEPGARRWELRRALGRNYEEVIKALDAELEKLGLMVKVIGEGDSESDRFVVTFREHPSLSDSRTFGWRVDDMAILTMILATILARGGKVSGKEVQRILEEKFPKWRIDGAIERFIRMGYLQEDDKGVLYLGWRTRAEVDEKALLSLLLGKESK